MVDLLIAALLSLASPLAAQAPSEPAPASRAPPAVAPSGSAEPAAPADGRIPIEDFAGLPFLSEPLLSPDGTRIAGRISQEGIENIGIWTLSGGPEQEPILIASSGTQSFEWADDNKLLFTSTGVFVIMIYGTPMPVPRQIVTSYDLRSRKLTRLGTGGLYENIIFIDPAGRYVLLSTVENMERTPHVERVNLDTGATVEVQPPVRGVWSWFADANGVVRVGVDYGERRTRIHYRADARSPLVLIETRRNFEDDSVIDMVRFVSNTDRGIIVTNAETGRFAVYEYDFATDTRGAVLFDHPEVDVTRAVFGADGSVDGAIYEDDRPRVRWLKPELERIQSRIDRTFPGHTNMIVNRSRDGNRILIFSSAADDPGTYYVYDQAARRMETFASPYERLIERRFAPVRPVRYRSRDGLDVPAYLTLPPGRSEQGLPLVVLPHGGPFARDSWDFNPEVQFLASRGYAVLQPNFRGSTGYGRTYVERGYGQFGTGMIDDIDEGVDWLAGQGIVDPARVCIMGASYGGYAAIWGAMRSPQRYRCAISMAGPTDLRRMLRYDVRFMIARRYAGEWRRRVQGEERTDLDAVSPAAHPEMLRVPLLLAHGEQDINVPPDQSRRLLRALRRRGAEVESVFYPKSGHGFNDAAELADYMRRVEAFLARHNPADSLVATEGEAASGGVPISPPSG